MSRLTLPTLLSLVVLAASPGTLLGESFADEVLARMDQAVEQAITDGKLPGAVLWLEHEGTVFKNAYGQRSIVPEREAMTLDTVFDAASLTKVVATTPCMLKLIEDGKLGLEDKVIRHLPELSGDPNKAHITIRHLLTHTSGLNAGIRRGYLWEGYENGLALACGEQSVGHAGRTYRYSDINFILLGEIVRRVSGLPLDVYAQRTIFAPLGMQDTSFRPGDAQRPRIAPTTVMPDASVLRGTVHDPTSRAMGGVAGHAGLFTTAHDLARYCRMLLNLGELDGTRVLARESVELMTSVQSPRNIFARRGLGFDIDSPYAGPRGTVFPVGSYGHTGWTGTSLWIDPFSRTFILLLSNRNHPAGGNVLALRHRLGTLAAEALPGFDFTEVPGALPELDDQERERMQRKAARPRGTVRNGIDVLRDRDFADLRGLKVGLITNQTGVTRDGQSTIDLLHAAKEVELVALFGPEHGIRGTLDGNVADGIDQKTGLKIHSLYASPTRRKPSLDALRDLDALVFDMQDIGCRYYTYISTMGLSMDAAAEAGIRFVVLDRVNPIGGTSVAGPLPVGEGTFVAYHDIPVQHGMTVGELAGLFRAERYPDLQLTVIPIDGWKRGRLFDATGLPWVKPSPNMPNLTAALLYPGIGWLEFTNLSVGRGTALPFELVGAPYVEPNAFADHLNRAGLPGLHFVPVQFTPTASAFKDQPCGGVRVLLKDRRKLRSVELGLALTEALRTLHPAAWEHQKLNILLRHPSTAGAIVEGLPRSTILRDWQSDLRKFAPRRSRHLLYP